MAPGLWWKKRKPLNQLNQPGEVQVLEQWETGWMSKMGLDWERPWTTELGSVTLNQQAVGIH